MKPRLVLHICCAPDEAWVVKCLHESHELTCFFCNPNIQPREEYVKRLAEARKVADHFGVEFASDPYAPQSWEEVVRDALDSTEGGLRCERCFLLRLRRTASFCIERGLQRFTTVMSISPHKRIGQLNAAGQQAAAEAGLIYEPYNFKKQDGFRKSILLSDELGLYRQDYCGCRLSAAERDERKRRAAERSAPAEPPPLKP
jgi:predicted adenine nucleotide alpha hydrolase (AANH) superfamily ATPase